MDDETLLRAEIAELKERISTYARRIEELLFENHELRADSIVSSTGVEPEFEDAVDVRRRKIARADGDLDNSRSPSGDNEWVLATTKKAANHKTKPRLKSDNHIMYSDRGKNNIKATHLEKSTQKKKVLKAIDANVMNIRKHIVDAKCSNFIVKQTAPHSPVKIIISDENEIKLIKKAL